MRKLLRLSMLPLVAALLFTSCDKDPKPEPVPGAPTNLSANVTENSAVLTWDAVEGATKYQVEVNEGTYDVTTTTYTATGLDYNANYTWKVRAVVGEQNSAWATDSFSTGDDPLYWVGTWDGSNFAALLKLGEMSLGDIGAMLGGATPPEISVAFMFNPADETQMLATISGLDALLPTGIEIPTLPLSVLESGNLSQELPLGITIPIPLDNPIRIGDLPVPAELQAALALFADAEITAVSITIDNVTMNATKGTPTLADVALTVTGELEITTDNNVLNGILTPILEDGFALNATMDMTKQP